MIKHPWLLFLVLHSILSQTTDKYSDEDRPYKFGFNIQGYQHRKEEKNEKGIIMGEYGFITADGYYRVTVYATDENDDFKIISMKNYYVGFPPEDPTTTPGPPSQSSVKARPPLSSPPFGSQPGTAGKDDGSRQPAKPFVRPQGLAACSDCSIPTTTQKSTQFNQGGGFGGGNAGGRFGGGNAGGGFGGSGGSFGQGPAGGQSPIFPQGTPGGSVQGPAGGQSPRFPQGALRGGVQGPVGGPRGSRPTSGGFGGGGPTGPGASFVGGGPQNQAGAPGGSDFPRGGNDFTQNNQLDGGAGRRPQIGEVRDGLPPGVNLNDIRDLLYTFNYTVGFHGHHEDGYRNGDKLGDYFFDGRDGVERKVEYLANEFGYQPNITLIDLPENDIRRPNEQTEKEYGLKGYEFKWFYRK